MKIQYDKKLRLNTANRERLAIINKILEDYQKDGYVLTLRQLYYQLVAKDIIANAQAEYIRLSNILKKGRMAGIVDWSAIEDRIRQPKLPYSVDDIAEAFQDTIDSYRLDRMRIQENYLEVWVEKDALSSILYRVTSKYHVRLMVNRGYSSVTAMFRAAQRFQYYGKRKGTILYFGDHDPSGLDMIRDIEDRMASFNIMVDVVPVALTMSQINKFNPPPNPAKIKDPRADWYIKQFGKTSWELDALPPRELAKLVEDNILSRIDIDSYNAMLTQEEEDIDKIRRIIKDLDL